MVRRIGFGEREREHEPAVRRRGQSASPPPEAEAGSDPGSGAGSETGSGASPSVLAAPASAPAPGDAPKKKERKFSIGPLIMLGVIWTFLLNIVSDAYGGFNGALWTVLDALDGRASALEMMIPLAAIAVFGAVATIALLRSVFR